MDCIALDAKIFTHGNEIVPGFSVWLFLGAFFTNTFYILNLIFDILYTYARQSELSHLLLSSNWRGIIKCQNWVPLYFVYTPSSKHPDVVNGMLRNDRSVKYYG